LHACAHAHQRDTYSSSSLSVPPPRAVRRMLPRTRLHLAAISRARRTFTRRLLSETHRALERAPRYQRTHSAGGCCRAMRDGFGKAVASSSAPTRKPRALVVEYDRWLSASIATLVEEVGYTVTTASNGYSGLRLALVIRPSLVVLGRALPELSAEELCAELRRATAGSGTLIIDDRTLLCDEPDLVPARPTSSLHVPNGARLALRHVRADSAEPICSCATGRYSGDESAGRTSRHCGHREAVTRVQPNASRYVDARDATPSAGQRSWARSRVLGYSSDSRSRF
jgi:hypothetical protein